jgi:hypothetical protein
MQKRNEMLNSAKQTFSVSTSGVLDWEPSTASTNVLEGLGFGIWRAGQGAPADRATLALAMIVLLLTG